jgi:hypothetical protein
MTAAWPLSPEGTALAIAVLVLCVAVTAAIIRRLG